MTNGGGRHLKSPTNDQKAECGKGLEREVSETARTKEVSVLVSERLVISRQVV
jgi:hypothetical protein